MYRIAIVPSSDCLLCSAASSSALDFACNARSASCNPKACCSWLKERALHFSSCNTIAMSTTRQLQMGNSSNNAVPWHQNGCETPLQTADVKLLTAHGIVAVSFESAFQSHLSRCTCAYPQTKSVAIYFCGDTLHATNRQEPSFFNLTLQTGILQIHGLQLLAQRH